MKTILVAGLSAGAVAAVAVGSVTVGQFLSGGGTQPEDVLPADTIAFARVDLDPSAGQKINTARLLRRFPSVEVRGQDDLKATLGTTLLEDNDLGLDYDEDVAPWLGDRAAVAVLPAPGSKDHVAPVVVLQFSDEAAMTATLEQAEKKLPGRQFGWATRDGYVFLAETGAQARTATAATQVLADDPEYAADAAALGVEDQVAVAWVDAGAAFDTLPAHQRKELAAQLGSAQPTGRMVAGVHVEPTYVEMTGQAHGLQASGVATAADVPGTGLVGDFPADTAGVLSVTNLGPAAVQLWKQFGEDPYLDLQGQAEQMGLDMPDDLGAVLGQEVGVGVLLGGDVNTWDFDAVARARTDRSERAVEVLRMVSGVEPDAVVRPTSDGWVLATSDALAAEASDGTPGLGNDPEFNQAVRDARTANALMYVDLARVVDFFLDPGDEGYADLKPLAAFGMSTTGTGNDGEFTARLLLR
jgi:hypothetical protein